METCSQCRAEQEDLSRRTFLKRALGVAGATLVLNFFPAESLVVQRRLRQMPGRHWWWYFNVAETTV